MKKFLIVLILLVCSLVTIGFCFNNYGNVENENNDYLRIHIRANSNSEVDQEIKYKIKDKFVDFITPKIAFCTTKNDVINLINLESENLEELANSILQDAGFDYFAKLKIKSEMFPTRTYEGYTLESGIYDALIVELGEAKGNNWWCVIYPPLCFTNYSSSNLAGVVYKSKIWEIIKKFFS